MLGLGLALSIAKKTLGDAIDGLLSTLRGRATYYENGSASKSTIKAIDDADVLDKATILLTPTATSDARVHSVKTYTGDELLDVSSLSGTNWTADGSGGFTNNGLGEGLNGSLNENTIIGATYKFTFDVTISGIANATFGGVTIPVFTTSGSKEYYVTATSSSTSFSFYLAPSGSPSMFVNNISVVDVSSDFDFDRASSATRINSSGLVQDMQSITDPELVLNGDFEELGDDVVTNGDFTTSGIPDTSSYTLGWYSNTDGVEIANGKLTLANDASGAANAYATDGVSSTNILTTNKIYKLTFDITDNTNCLDFQIYQNAGSFVSVTNTVGSYTYYITNTSNSLFLFRNNTVNSSISLDNVSVQQIDPNDRWSLGDKWSIANGVARLVSSDSSGSGFIQSSVFTIGNTYNITFDATVVSGEAKLESSGGGSLIEIDETKTYNHTFVADRTDLYFNRVTSVSDISLDNISVKDITFSTDVDLARINYDSNGDNGHILLEPTSTNFVPYSEDFSQSDWVKQTNITPTYNTTETLSPDGTYNATKLVGNGTDGIYDSSLSITGDVTRSVYLKSVSGTINVKLKDSNVDIGTETLTVTTEWQRFYLSGDNGTSSQGIWIDDIPLSGVYIFGAQVENLPYATSYIPTLMGSTVTRAAETLTGSGNSTLINSTEGVLYAEIAALADSGLVRYLGLNDGSNNNRVVILNDGTANRIRAIVSSGGTKYADLFYNVTDVTDFHKVAVKYKANDFALWIDGVERATDTSGSAPIGLNDLEFDLNTGGAFYGKCKALAVFNEALSDSELTNLTS